MQHSKTDDLREFNKLVQSSAQNPGYGLADKPRTDNCVSAQENQISDVLKSSNSKLWAVSGDAYLPCDESVNNLPPAHYVIDTSFEKGIFFRRHDFSIDDLISLPDSASEYVINQIKDFWRLESHFREYGFLWKRGMLLWGPAGSGKTSTLQIIAQDIIRRNGIVVSVYTPKISAIGLQILRKIEPKRPVLALLEDIDAITHQHGEADLLALLDGEHQIDNIVYLATTNYPERLDPRLVNRPSRFDLVEKISMPTLEARRIYLGTKSKRLQENPSQLKQWSDDTEGFSVAHLKELIISVEVFKASYKDSIERLKVMMECCSSSDDYMRRKITGFGNQQLKNN